MPPFRIRPQNPTVDTNSGPRGHGERPKAQGSRGEKMRDVFVIGVGHTAFGKFLERNIKSLTEEAVTLALKDAEIEKGDLESAFFGNAMQGLVTGQEMVRGQVALRHVRIDGIPIINCENACATGSTAFHLAWQSISGGHVDVALAVGTEKLYMEDTEKMFRNYDVGMDMGCRGKKNWKRGLWRRQAEKLCHGHVCQYMSCPYGYLWDHPKRFGLYRGKEP